MIALTLGVLVTLAAPAPGFVQDSATAVARISPAGIDVWDRFGQLASLSHDRLAISAVHLDRGEIGGVFFYRRGSAGWEQEQVVLPSVCWPEGFDSHPPCFFGRAIDLYGRRALISSLGGDLPGGGTLGLVEVLTWRQGEGWVTGKVLRSPQLSGVLGYGFGNVLSQNSTTLAVGADQYPVEPYVGGAVFLYEQYARGDWQLVQTLHAPREGAFGWGGFGFAIDMTERLLVVSEPTPFGRVHVYTKVSGEWTLLQTVEKPANQEYDDYFGFSVAIDPKTETFVVGDIMLSTWAPRPGLAHIFERDRQSGQWFHADTFDASEPWSNQSYNDRFGMTVAASNGLVVVGGPSTLFGGVQTGGAEVHTKIEDQWTLTQRYTFDQPGAAIGWAVATDEYSTVVTALGWPVSDQAVQYKGMAFIYEESSGDSACGPYAGEPTLNILGERTGAENFTLAVHGLSPGTLSAFVIGFPSAPQPFGGGRLCVAQPYRMLGSPVRTTSSGTVYHEVSSSALAGTEGLTLAFQCLYSNKGGLLRGTSSARILAAESR